jgi:AcrR family transcriptional regulator
MSSGDPETRERILKETWRLMELRKGQGVRLGDIARAAGISRQAVYLHFASRTELLVATARYVDQIHGLDERLAAFRQTTGGVESLRVYVDFWVNYIPEIYGLAKALLAVRETDKAAAAAWEDRMEALREGCRCVIDCLQREHLLAAGWNSADATEMMWGMSSVTMWEDLTIGRGWSQTQYLARMKEALERIFIRSGAD